MVSPGGIEVDAVGRRFGPFEAVAGLGEGGFGRVYLAERRDGGFAQKVALKVVRQRPESAALLHQERRILSELKHPNIARIIDGGEAEGGVLWFAMELVEGEAIDDFLASKAHSPQLGIRLLIDLCRALEFAHQRLIVHGDIKPSNILVSRDGTPHLLDFGIARLADGTHDECAVPMFTLGWASPEQIAGGRVGTPSDVYQLGLLARHLLLDHDGRQRASRLLLHNLKAIVARCCCQAPEQRYANVGALERDLIRATETRPAIGGAFGTKERLHFFLVRNRPRLLLASAAMALMVVAAGYHVRKLHIERQLAQQEAAHAQAAAEFLANLFRFARRASDDSDNPAMALMLEQATDSSLHAMGKRTADLAVAAEVLAKTHLELHHPERAWKVLESYFDSQAAEIASLPVQQQFRLLLLQCRASILLGKVETGTRLLERGYDMLKTMPNDSSQHPLLELTLTAAKSARGGHDESNRLALLQSAEKRWERTEMAHTREFAELFLLESYAYNVTNQWESALRAGQRAVDILTETAGLPRPPRWMPNAITRGT